MQPAREDVVQNLTFPASAATAAERQVVTMSLPSWGPCPRGAPKSSVYAALPTSGKTIGVAVGGAVLGSLSATAEEVRASPAAASSRRTRAPRAVVRSYPIPGRAGPTSRPAPGSRPEALTLPDPRDSSATVGPFESGSLAIGSRP